MASDAFSIAWPISIYWHFHLLFLYFHLLANQSWPSRHRIGPGLVLLYTKLVPNIQTIWWVLSTFYYPVVLCMVPLKKTKKRGNIQTLISRLSFCREMQFFSPSYKSFQTHSITELSQLQTASSESTWIGLFRRKRLSPIVLFLFSSLSSVLFGMAGVGGADAAGGRGARLFFFLKSFRDAPCDI